jgi:methanogenic corrinoid protein MtbC1
MDSVSGSANKKKILICVPVGEEHHLGCDVLETYLSIKGFIVYNMGTSMPTESIINFIDNNKIDIVFVSITLPDNILAGQRMVRKINEEFNIPILIGGYAMQSEKIPKFDGKIISEKILEKIQS